MLEKASIDGLTGALNRKSAEAKIGELMQNKNCKGYLFMIDIDDFKTVNDTMGHAMGDLALINLVKILKEKQRALRFWMCWRPPRRNRILPSVLVLRLILQQDRITKTCICLRTMQCMFQRKQARTVSMLITEL